MVKLIGMLLVVSSLLALVAGAYIDIRNEGKAEITGNVISNIITQPEVSLSFLDYLEAFVFSYSIISFIMGFMFLFRV